MASVWVSIIDVMAYWFGSVKLVCREVVFDSVVCFKFMSLSSSLLSFRMKEELYGWFSFTVSCGILSFGLDVKEF